MMLSQRLSPTAQILESRNDRVGLSALRCIIKGDLLNEVNLFFYLPVR